MPFASTASSLTYRKDSVRIPVPLNTNSGSRTDGFVYKYGPDGQALWSARMSCAGDGGNTNGPFPQATATDSTGAVYAVGFGFLSSSGSKVIAPQNLFYNADGSFAAAVTLPSITQNRAPFCVKYSATGVYQWMVFVIPTVAASQNSIAGAVVVDSSDNVYFTGTVGIGGGNVTAYNADGSAFGTVYAGLGTSPNAFLVKYNSAGTAQWLTRAEAANGSQSRGLAIDSTGVYMAGAWSSGTLTAYNASGTAFATTIATVGSSDVFLVKYTLSGTVSWFTRISSTAAEVGYAAAVDGAGNLFVAGSVGTAALTAYNFDGTAFGTTIASVGLTDSFVVKYNGTGTVQWIAKMGGTAADIGFGITTDSGNNTYIVGQQGSATTFTAYNFDGSAFGTTLPSRTSTSAFLVKYNATGSVQWAAQMGPGCIAYAVTSDTSDNLYVALRAFPGLVVYNFDGTTFATVSITTSPATCLVTYNSSGVAQRTRVINSSSSPLSVCRDSSNNIFLGGSFSAYTTQNLGPSATVALTLPIAGSSDAFVVKYTTNGRPWWAARIASTALDSANAVATDSSGNIYVTGGVAATATFYSAGGAAFSTTIPANYAFVVKYNWLGIVQWVASFTSAAGQGIAVDSAGNVYAAGIGVPLTNKLYAFNFNGATGVTQSTTGTAPAILVKYNTTGTAQWIARIATTNTHAFNRVTVDSSDNVIVAGYANTGGVVFNASGTSFATITTAGGTDALVVKYNSSGSVQWLARMGSGADDQGIAVASDVSGNVYVAGYGGSTTQAVTIYNASGTSFATLPVAVGLYDGFVVKYASTGVAQWAARFTSTDWDVPRGLATDSAGNLYMAGNSGDQNSVSTTPVLFYSADGTRPTTGITKNGGVGWLVKYSPSGVLQWNVWIDDPNAKGDWFYDVATDRRGNVYAGGTDYPSLSTISVSIVELGWTNAQSVSTCVNAAKFEPNGLLKWYQTIKGASNIGTTYGLATDLDCNLIVVGSGPFTETTNIYAKA